MDIKDRMKLLRETEVVSWHEHVSGVMPGRGTPEDCLDVARCDSQMEALDSLGVDKIVVSKPIPTEKHCPPERCVVANNIVYEATKRYPGRILGQAFVNPGFTKETIYELERCVKELGFVGVKLYHQYFMDDPAQFAMIEKCIELDIPILMHCAHIMDPLTRACQPRCSDGFHMANAAKRYPEATFIMGHIGGGGDWKWAIKAIADCPNVYADIGGSVFDRPLIEESVALLGADRLLFATDGAWSSGVGKLLGADISDEDKKTIFSSRAFNKFLKKAGK